MADKFGCNWKWHTQDKKVADKFEHKAKLQSQTTEAKKWQIKIWMTQANMAAIADEVGKEINLATTGKSIAVFANTGD